MTLESKNGRRGEAGEQLEVRSERRLSLVLACVGRTLRVEGNSEALDIGRK